MDTQRLALSICLGTAFPTLGRTPAVLGIQPGSQGQQNSMGFPFLLPLGFFKGIERPAFPQGICLALLGFVFF